MADVAPEADLREFMVHSPMQKIQLGRTHSGFETQRRRHQKPKPGVPVAPKKDICVCQKL